MIVDYKRNVSKYKTFFFSPNTHTFKARSYAFLKYVSQLKQKLHAGCRYFREGSLAYLVHERKLDVDSNQHKWCQCLKTWKLIRKQLSVIGSEINKTVVNKFWKDWEVAETSLLTWKWVKQFLVVLSEEMLRYTRGWGCS